MAKSKPVEKSLHVAMWSHANLHIIDIIVELYPYISKIKSENETPEKST